MGAEDLREPHKFAMVPLRSRLLWQEASEEITNVPKILRHYEWVRDRAVRSGLENGNRDEGLSELREIEAALAPSLNTLMRGILSYSTGFGVSPQEAYQFTTASEGSFSVVVWHGDIMILNAHNSGMHITIGAQNGSGPHEGNLEVAVRGSLKRSIHRAGHHDHSLMGTIHLSRERAGGSIEDRMEFIDGLPHQRDLVDVGSTVSPFVGEYILGRNPTLTRLILMCDALKPWMKSSSSARTNGRGENVVMET